MTNAEATPQQSIRRAYGRGYHDAIKAMEKEDMNNARLADAERSLNSMAAKVLDATPKAEAWSVSQIVGEMKRTGSNVSHDVVLGCLGTMLRIGLVREPDPRHFIRVLPKPRAELSVVEALPVPATGPSADGLPEAPPARDTLTKLANLSADVRTMAAQFANLAAAIDDVAIEVEERIAGHAEDSQKLAQLRALLKGIGA